MAKYKLTNNCGVHDTEKGRFIPDSSSNKDWRAYQKWLAEGNTPDPVSLDELALDALVEQQTSLNHDLKDVDKILLKLIVVMFRVGKNKGLWNVSDFEAELPNILTTVNTLRNKLQQLEDLS